jgi:hypothetical protein
LWHGALDYISTIPGCEAICWGSDLESNLPTVLLVAQWHDASSWRTFQQSPSVTTLIRDMLRADPLNQTVRLHLSNIHGLDKIVEISFLALKPVDDKDRITQDMVSLYDLAGRTNNITSYVNTAERYASWIIVSSPGRQLAEEQPGLMVYGAGRLTMQLSTTSHFGMQPNLYYQTHRRFSGIPESKSCNSCTGFNLYDDTTT